LSVCPNTNFIFRIAGEIKSVGYVQSLTFPARRMRLHPEQVHAVCSRCGEVTEWGVRRMVFEMGESRPKGSVVWLDPFAAFRIDAQKGPIPIRPQPGKAVWREFASLFLTAQSQPDAGKKGKQFVTQRPSVLDQIAALEMEDQPLLYPFRCVGLRTDMKAKVFEWVDAGFDVPLNILRDDSLALEIRQAIEFATDCAGVLTYTFKQYFGGKARKSEKNLALNNRMEQTYWAALAESFRLLTLHVADETLNASTKKDWAEMVSQTGLTVFVKAADSIGDDAASLASRVQAEKWCRIRLELKRKEYIHE
jgi:CRISPR system Cascade subunit CasA